MEDDVARHTTAIEEIRSDLASVEVGDDPALANEVRQIEGRVTSLENRPAAGSVDSVYLLGGEYLADNSMVTGINLLETDEFKPYPNPASTTLQVSYVLSQTVPNATLRIYDIRGARVEEVVLRARSGSETLNVSSYDPGLYFMQIFGDNSKSVTRKFVVE